MTAEERKQLITGMMSALKEDNHMLTDDERRWVRLAIEKEAQSIQLRKAIIEKTLASLAWSALLGLGWLIVSVFSNHTRG